MRRRHLPWAIALVLFSLGFMLATQMRVQQKLALADDTTLQRASDLAQQLGQAEEERDKLMAEVEQLRKQQVTTANDTDKQLAEQLQQAQLQGGLLPVTGPGVVVTLNDSTRPAKPGDSPLDFIIHDQDILMIVNDLRVSGAEAISINGQRLTGSSEIRCVGPVVTINGIRTAPPVVISAIGAPDTLAGAITMRDSYASTLTTWGITVNVKKETNLTVPAFKGSLQMQYGHAADQEVANP
ncbi:MAG: DUF881 domain-containing protein [Mycobacterium leprae]